LPDLIQGLSTQTVLADKGYDSNANWEAIHATGAVACIPPKNRLQTIAYDRHLYKERNMIERFFGKIK